ncbi:MULTISPECIES: (Fe-S)-binding protein [unclassified Sphingobacterium]|uniref:(Fe-S)-binding protein n=1 Tax=unclassified Sphingobacterium TaxID=2609468 RepID=UPI0025E1CEF6|nr:MULTISPECIES: (Fe-S)-binding protein [unclassified Sphingobacterium]
MRVGLFIPCYIDAIYPKVGIATLELLEKLGVEVIVPLDQTCCGQPMGNEGDQKNAAAAEALFCKNFEGFDYIVGPAGSCVKHVRQHFDAIPQTTQVQQIRKNTFELVEFLTDVLQVSEFPWTSFNHSVAIHNSCSAIRGLHIQSRSEWQEPRFNKTEELLHKVSGVTVKHLDRPDECCGFGGTFCVTDEAVSVKMGQDKVADYERQEVAYVVSPDMSCLMHQQGIAERDKSPLKFVHIAQVLNNGPY